MAEQTYEPRIDEVARERALEARGLRHLVDGVTFHPDPARVYSPSDLSRTSECPQTGKVLGSYTTLHG